MSWTKNQHEAERWLKTAEEDLQAADVLLRAGSFAQACFYPTGIFDAQQSGEKAVKALWYRMDADPWGHSVQKLIADFPEKHNLPDLEQ